MKYIIRVMVLCLIAQVAAFDANASEYDWDVEIHPANPRFEIRGPATFIFPKDKSFETVFSGGIRGILWLHPNVGLSAGLDLQTWKLAEEYYNSYVYQINGNGIHRTERGYGDIRNILLSLSVLYNIPLDTMTHLTADAGLSYVNVSSDVQISVREHSTINGQYISDSVTQDIDIDNGAIGFICVDITQNLSDSYGIFVGCGYQFDVTKGAMSSGGIEGGEIELAGSYIRGGVRLFF